MRPAKIVADEVKEQFCSRLCSYLNDPPPGDAELLAAAVIAADRAALVEEVAKWVAEAELFIEGRSALLVRRDPMHPGRHETHDRRLADHIAAAIRKEFGGKS